jgi:phosphoserine phosphatase
MPSTSKKQHNFMAAVANNPKFAKKAGVPKSVGEEFMKADKTKKMAGGGMPMVEKDGKKVPAFAADGVGKMKKGGMAHSDMAKDKPMMKKVAAKAVKGHEKKMHGMAKGGSIDGCATKGKTKGTMIKMKRGGSC